MQKLKYKHICFLGAEGIGMSALINILEQQKNFGLQDTQLQICKRDLSYGKMAELPAGIDLVVRSTAIASDDVDFVELKQREVEIWHRSDMLNYLSEGFKQIVVSGTHGKTTCSAMLSYLLQQANYDPSFAVGGILIDYDTNGKAGQGEYFVLEGDESDKSFTKTNPYLALVTCVEPDHLENYPGGFEEIKSCFIGFLDRAKIKVINIDDPVLATYAKAHPEAITYSETELEDYGLSMKGKHNQLNALGVMKAAEALGLTQDKSITILRQFNGIKRRFELINDNYNGIKVYDDYAHHPSEIKAVLEAALSLNPKRLVFVYQPHHPERTKQFWDEFVAVFKTFPAEHLCLIADVYVARSKHIANINSERMVSEINLPNVKFLPASIKDTTTQGNYADMISALKPGIDGQLRGCDYLFIVGAGNIAKVASAYAKLKLN